MVQIDTAVVGERHLDDGNQAFAPGDLIGVMLVGADEHDRLMLLAVAFELRCLLLSQKPLQESFEQCATGGGQLHAHKLLHAVDGAGGTGPTGDDATVRAGIDRLLYAILCLMQDLGGRPSTDIVFGVAVGVELLLAQEIILDKMQRPTGGGVVCIQHQPLPERRLYQVIDADDLFAQVVQIDRGIAQSLHGLPLCPMPMISSVKEDCGEAINSAIILPFPNQGPTVWRE